MNLWAPLVVNVCVVYPSLAVVLTVPPSPLCGPLYATITIPDPPVKPSPPLPLPPVP